MLLNIQILLDTETQGLGHDAKARQGFLREKNLVQGNFALLAWLHKTHQLCLTMMRRQDKDFSSVENFGQNLCRLTCILLMNASRIYKTHRNTSLKQLTQMFCKLFYEKGSTLTTRLYKTHRVQFNAKNMRQLSKIFS